MERSALCARGLNHPKSCVTIAKGMVEGRERAGLRPGKAFSGLVVTIVQEGTTVCIDMGMHLGDFKCNLC